MKIKKELIAPYPCKFDEYWNDRKAPISMLVLHSTPPQRQGDDYYWTPFMRHKVSVHYVILPDGKVKQLVEDENRAWHAGTPSIWGNRDDINSHSVGIEIYHPTNGQSPFSLKQIDTVIKLSRIIVNKYDIPPHHVLGHSDVAPWRKFDPGHCFPWELLAKKGVGLWLKPEDASKVKENNPEKLLERIGYDMRSPAASAYAFARHFAPEYVRVEEDLSRLVKHVVPEDILADPGFMREKAFIEKLKATTYSFEKSMEFFGKRMPSPSLSKEGRGGSYKD